MGATERAEAARDLGLRLRALRERAGLSQKRLGELLANGNGKPLSTSTISMWETGADGKAPPVGRLEAYARLFSTKASLTDVAETYLDDWAPGADERATEAALTEELLTLRRVATGELAPVVPPNTSLWAFTDGAPVTFVCADARALASPYGQHETEPNYVRAHGLADVDALLELHGQIRAENPNTTVRVLSEYEVDMSTDLNAHVVVLGGVAMNPLMEYFMARTGMPLRQERGGDGPDTFVYGEKRYGEPLNWSDDSPAVKHDIGVFVRAPNPLDPARTLTLCNGVYTRGVLGAALCFVHPTLRDANSRYIAETFGGLDSWGLILRVEVYNRRVVPPNLLASGVVLEQWPSGTDHTSPAPAPA